jgi:hypothetical protein
MALVHTLHVSFKEKKTYTNQGCMSGFAIKYPSYMTTTMITKPEALEAPSKVLKAAPIERKHAVMH